LLGAVRKGSLSFEDLRRTAFNVIDSIAVQATKNALGGGTSGSSSGGLGGLLGGLGTSLLSGLMGLPGRATGGPVSPGSASVVGERGPELFVPTSAGRVENSAPSGGGRDVRVAITVNSGAGTSSAQALQRSSRQVAGAVRRALSEY